MSSSQTGQNPPKQPKLEDIDAALPLVRKKVARAKEDILEEDEIDRTARVLKNKILKARIKDRTADRNLRDMYANRIMRYLEAYSGVVGLMVLFQAMSPRKFSLPTEVLALLVGSTAVAAIGLVGFVARGLFRTPTDKGHGDD